MADYNPTTDFSVKDGLPQGNPEKAILGSDFDDEFDNISTAVNSKANSANPTFTGTATFATIDTTVSFQIGGVTLTATPATLNGLDGRVTALEGASVAFADLTSTPTTLAGYGITDAASTSDGALAQSAVQPGDNVSSLTNDADYVATTFGKVRLESGADINPAYSFDSDFDTGMYRISSNTLGFSTAGIERLRITNSGVKAASAFRLGDWKIELSGNDLVFDYNGTDVFRISTTGALTAADDITAFGSP
ncbi:MAG: hypothetical protein HRU12_08970 [Phaeodactylibacter sp.]|nr:hypothetical protein [Phaeodactylibacter sp.]